MVTGKALAFQWQVLRVPVLNLPLDAEGGECFKNGWSFPGSDEFHCSGPDVCRRQTPAASHLWAGGTTMVPRPALGRAHFLAENKGAPDFRVRRLEQADWVPRHESCRCMQKVQVRVSACLAGQRLQSPLQRSVAHLPMSL